jgi:tryptophanyl-tRNA synthetase
VYTPKANDEIAPPCKTGELGCVDCKMRLAENLNEALRPLRDKRQKLIKNPDDVWDVLKVGADRARSRAQSMMEKVYKAMKTNYRG